MSAEPDLPLLSWRPPTVQRVFAFPATRRRAFIAKNAAAAARYSEAAGENYIRSIIDRHLERLIRIGVPAPQAEADADALASALRSEHWRMRVDCAS